MSTATSLRRTTHVRRAAGRTLGVLALVVAAAAMSAAPASAHAELVSTDPAADTVVATAPSLVTLRFSEPVDIAGSTVHVLDDTGARVDDGPVATTAEDVSSVAVPLKSGLRNGSYVVSWIVTSDDTHPVSGSFTFAVGTRTSTGAALAPTRNDPAGLALGVLRWLGYVGLALGPGLLLVALLLWPDGLRDRTARRLALAGLGLLVVSTVGGMLLQGVWASGAPLSALWQAPDTLDTHSRKFDLVYAWRVFLLVAFAVTMAVAFPTRSTPTPSRRVLLGAVGVCSVALVATWPVVGHSAVGELPLLALAVNLVHSLGMVLWLGGLVFVLVCLSPAGREPQLSQVLPRFSRLALACAAALLVTGGFMAWREVGAASGLTTTEFGRVLLGKLALVAVLLLLGRSSKRWVTRHLLRRSTGPDAGADASSSAAAEGGVDVLVQLPVVVDAADVAGLRRGVAAEIVVATLVLAVTAALVVVAPGI
jgi:copper transport protein